MLSLLDISKRFSGVQALDGCSFTVDRGRMLGFLGPNGAGKTTAMRAIFGLVRLDAGRGRSGTDGRSGCRSDSGSATCRRSAGSTRECRSASSSPTSAVCTGWTTGRRALRQRAGSSGSASTIAPSAKVEELSHGNQQRAQLAAALLHEPELLVLDEPFAGLDPIAVQTLAEVLRGEAARGAAVLFSSHQLELVEDICEEVAIIDHGRIVATGDLDSLRRASQRRRIELELEGAPHAWLPDVAGLELVERRNGDLRLLVGRDVDPEQVLAEAERAAQVVGFNYGPPTLAELFVELVGP